MRKVRKAVIAAAGRGRRHYPASSVVPKEMFPLVDRDGVTKPVLQMVVEEAFYSRIEQICIVAAPGKDSLYRQHFAQTDTPIPQDWARLESEKLAELGKHISFVLQDEPLGLGDAVYRAREFVGGEPFLLLLGDHVFVSDTKDRCARQLIAAFEELPFDALTGVQPNPERLLHLFGVICGIPFDPERGIYRAQRIIEKPSIDQARRELATDGLPMGNYLAHFGMHIFTPAIFDALEFMIRQDIRSNGEIQLTAAQEHLRLQTNNYGCMIVRGQRCDTGVPYGLLETQLTLGLAGIHRTEVCEVVTRILASQIKS
ncbi:MAG TPA: sugar phosphate nucleotidyltransferase [Tepidisphaeraceae bacterium]|nr:sugar phosphate nucleotidyltransferase [Tepidisphaeraceae bacterium]